MKMNKQQLASKIWESANKMRSKIDANEYKDYILGFIFYKFLSNKEVKTLEEMGLSSDELSSVTESNTRVKELMQKNIGYFISYENLFSTWLTMKNDFSVQNVRDALSAFNRLISPTHKKVFEGIFATLDTGLSKLGDNSASQTKAIRDLIYLIKDIPMDDKQDYDVLGFIYEYLISNFAANAGKKAGEFYTPHEVSLLMSEIIAEHLKDRDKIEIYDPTSGSGSLLINIGKTASKYIKNPNAIKFYAQELKENTYNLTRMNLVMRGILPDNIVTRNGDTLEDDWPYFDENHAYNPLFVDAVVSNPPYSQNWDPTDRDVDPRFKDYGLAPKSKADYAFLLHDLYHLKPNGIMTIVLPHGVLFRGGDEGEIRKNLIERHNIYAIIGLPANIFFGTGIPTIIMVLKKGRVESDIQIIDASKGFIKDGKNNRLRACDIKKIVDAVISRKDIDKFSKVISLDEIRKNDYNLNIPRYVDSSEEQETYDIYASMNGGIPKTEINKLNNYFDVFPNLKKDLFKPLNSEYYQVKVDNISDFINNHSDIKQFKESFKKSFDNFDDYLKSELIDNCETVDINSEEQKLSNAIFGRFDSIKLIDKYKAYQILDNEWNKISGDLELIQNEGIDACRKVAPIYETKKKGDRETQVQVGSQGHIIPFELIEDYKLTDLKNKIETQSNRVSEIDSEIQEVLDELTEDDKSEIETCLNESNDAFVPKEVAKKAKEYLKSPVLEGSIEQKIIKVNNLYDEQKSLNKQVKDNSTELSIEASKEIENLTNEDITVLLKKKWIDSIVNNIDGLVDELITDFSKKVEHLSKKYSTTLNDLEREIKDSERKLSSMLDELTGSEYDMEGIRDLKALLDGESHE